jgi:4-oxalocrotonate tautomerase
MPYVNVRITREGATAEQKAEVIRRMTQVLVDVLKKNPDTTVVVIDEVDTDNWGIGGTTVTERRRKGGRSEGKLKPCGFTARRAMNEAPLRGCEDCPVRPRDGSVELAADTDECGRFHKAACRFDAVFMKVST